MRTLLGCVLPAVLATLLLATPAAAQDLLQLELRDSQQRLETLRRERERLQDQLEELRAQARDLTGELTNIEQQTQTQANALREIDFQALALARNVDQTTSDLLRTRDQLRERQLILYHRVRSIYKRGPLHTVQVLLSAESFGDLLNRYRYLHLMAVYDQMLVEQIEELERSLADNEEAYSRNLAELQRLRAERVTELAHLQALESKYEETLQGFEIREQQAADRIRQIARDEARLTELVSELERQRLEEERRRRITGARPEEAPTLSTESLGTLRWPVTGDIIYQYGPQRRPDGIVLRWNGIGIAAQAGTEVRAVESGNVVSAMSIEGYGPSVVISHGGGYYTLYLRLGSIRVTTGERVESGHVIGTVGGERTAEGPHIEFRVHAPGPGGPPVPVNPLPWLRERGSP